MTLRARMLKDQVAVLADSRLRTHLKTASASAKQQSYRAEHRQASHSFLTDWSDGTGSGRPHWTFDIF